MKEAQLLIAQLTSDEVAKMVAGEPHTIELGGEFFELTSDDVEVTRTVHEGVIAMHGGLVTVALDTELDESLILEGIARELVNKINTMRKSNNYAVTDRIKLQMAATPKVQEALHIHGEYVKQEVLAAELHLTGETAGTAIDINGEPTVIMIQNVSNLS